MLRRADYKPRVDGAAQYGGQRAAWVTRAMAGAVVMALMLGGIVLGGSPVAAAAPADDRGNPPDSRQAPPRDDAAIAAGLMISPAAAARQRRAVCDEARRQGEIVVCGVDRGEQWRVPSTAESDPKSRQGRDIGVPTAPNVSSLPDCAIVKCHGFGKVPPPIYVVDFSKLPEAPAGSDADRIAKGEAPAR